MTREMVEAQRQSKLRLKAVSQLTGLGVPATARLSGSAAMEVLWKLASSPESAPEALALLHELQVHQVELEVQAEELTRSRAECEAALYRQIQLYDFAPVASFTVDRDTILRELNLTGANLLGFARDDLLGRPLESFLTVPSGRILRQLLGKVLEGQPAEVCVLELGARDGVKATVHVSVESDPAGGQFLVAFFETDKRTKRPSN